MPAFLRHFVALAIVVSVLPMVAASLHVPARADMTSIEDPTDSLASVDIARVTSSHTPAGRLRYRIDAHGAFVRRLAPCLFIRSGRPDPVLYRICGDGRIVDDAAGPTGARARVTRPTPRTVAYTFPRSAIGGPSWHRWRAVVLRNRCPDAVCDAAPDGGWVMHRTHIRYERWAELFFREMAVPRCRDNLVVLLAWQANENTLAVFNPLATTREMPGSWPFNPIGVQNYVSLAQGLDATRLTIENGYRIYGYGLIARRLDRCARPMQTARAIRDSRWCFGCSRGDYVTGFVPLVLGDFRAYASREISTAPP